MLSKYKREFLGLCDMDSLFPVKFAYLLDRAFQNFVQDLGDFHNKEDPILRARKTLKRQQIQDIDAAMTGFKTGAISKLFLPGTLQVGTPGKETHPSTDGGAKGAGGGKKARADSKGEEGAKGKTPPEDWWTTNPSPVEAWSIPEGKDYFDYFDFRKEALKANTESWPKATAHAPSRSGGRKTFICVKYQAVGKCHFSCRKAHIIPEKIPAADRKTMDDKFKLIYG
jgi:hypothetical protein